MKSHGLFLVALFFLAPTMASAQWHGPDAPDSLSFQGFLTDTTGAVVPDGNYAIRFRMYKGSTQIWEQTSASVPINSGIFNVILTGNVTWPLDTVAFNAPIDLGIKLGADPEMTPRTPLTSTAYALGMRGMYAVWHDDGFLRSYNLIGGAADNSVSSGVTGATIGGGGGSLDGTLIPNSVTDDFGTVAGGFLNTASNLATVGGGSNNRANGQLSTVSGGLSNFAIGERAAIGGGSSNTADGQFSTVPGGRNNEATHGFTFAAGQAAQANHSGTFVWADSADNGLGTPFASTDENQFLLRARGGVGIGTNNPDAQLDVAGAIHSSGPYSSTILYRETNKSGIPDGDGFRMRYDGDFFQTNFDALVFEKTDGSASPDGGIAFVNSGSGGIDNVAMVIRGDGDVGIGTKTPVRPLHVAGDYYGRGHMYLYAFGGDSTSGTAYVMARDLTSTSDIGLTLRTQNGATINDAIVMAPNGDVTIAGNLSKGGGSFKIDHPLDPENKYLYHSFVESPDMMNVYNGNTILNEIGAATIELPSYFEALNKEFRYQLTAIGAPGPNLFVAEKISGNQFSIAGGTPGMEVSWQITGIRKDPYAEHNRIEVEVEKPVEKRGTYLHPDLYAGTN